MKKSKYMQNNAINVFFWATLGGAFIAMLCILALYFFDSRFFDGQLAVFSDFVEIMNVSIEDSPYLLEGSSYPPFAIIILYPFALICKNVFSSLAGQTLSVNELTLKLLDTYQFWISICLFFIICTTIIICLVSKKYELRGSNLFKVSSIIVLSAPFIYTVARGNSILIALIFVMLFLLFKDNKKPILRELSYVCLAISGCLKIYPLFFGVFLLKDKKVLASLRVAAYFFIIFFASFFFFAGDLNDWTEFTENLGGFMSNETRLTGFNNLSISALIFKVIHVFAPNLTAESTVFSVLNIIIIALIFLLSTVAAVATKNDFSRLLICSAIVVLIPSISYFYVIIFTLLPFLELLIKGNKEKKYYYSFLFLYISLFVIPSFFIPHSIIIIALLIFEVLKVLKNEVFIKGKNTAKL